MYVFQILYNSPGGVPEDYRNTELYKACVTAGLIPSGAVGPPAGQWDRQPVSPLPSAAASKKSRQASPPPHSSLLTPHASQTAIEEGLSQELSIRIEGMWCVACSWLIEQLVRKMDGVLSAGIYFFSDIAQIKYMPHLVQPQAIIENISRLGYKASSVESTPDSDQSRSLVVRLGISAILSMNIMMISFALWAGFFEQVGREGAALFFLYTLCYRHTGRLLWRLANSAQGFPGASSPHGHNGRACSDQRAFGLFLQRCSNVAGEPPRIFRYSHDARNAHFARQIH